MEEELESKDEQWRSSGSAVHQFDRTIHGIRELLAIVEPHLPTGGFEFDSLTEGFTDEQRVAATTYLAHWVGERRRRLAEAVSAEEEESVAADASDGGGAGDEPTPPSKTAESDERSPELTPFGVVAGKEERDRIKRAADGQLPRAEFMEYLGEAFKDDAGRLMNFLERFRGSLSDPDKTLILNRAMLTTAVAAFEALLARMLSVQHDLFPGLLERETKQFSLEDLHAFDTIEDARKAAVDQRVDALMREGFESWENWFSKRAGLTLADFASDYDTLCEVLQRRHLIVHTGGRVSRQYLAKLGKTEPPVGTWLSVDSEYLERALDELQVIGIALGQQLRSMWFSDRSDGAIEELHKAAYRLLEMRRHRACRKLCEVGIAAGIGGWTCEAMRVNAWIARKELDGSESIASEVTAWNVSALAPEFELAKRALLDDLDAVYALIPDLIKSKQLSVGDLRRWPLLAGARNDERFQPFTDDQGDTEPEPAEGSM